MTDRRQDTGHIALIPALLALMLMALCGVAQAQQSRAPGELQVHLTQHKVVKGENGKDKLVTADQARPGEVIEYRATYANTAKSPIKDVYATLPVPAGMQFVAESATPANALAMLDNQKFEPIPIKRKVTLPSGAIEEREVPASEYKALRWRLGAIPAGKSAVVSARMRLEPAGETVAEAVK